MIRAKYFGVPPSSTVDRELRSYGYATAGQTSWPFTGTPGYVDFFLNHVKLAPDIDFQANGTTVTLLGTPAAGGEFFEIIARKTVPISNTLTQIEADGRYLRKSGVGSDIGVSTSELRSPLQSISATVNANALTVTLNSKALDFRSSSLTDGNAVTRLISNPVSLVVPSSATLGTVNATAARLIVLALDNAGTVELGIVNLSGGLNLDETSLINTTAISASATAANVVYSTTARTSVPFRVVGFVDITEATAGTWVTAPTLVQGTGGQVLAAMASLGYGQTWQDVKASRVAGTTYYNTTGKPIFVMVSISSSASGAIQATIDGNLTYGGTGTGGAIYGISFIVKPGGSYAVTAQAGTPTLQTWHELR